MWRRNATAAYTGALPPSSTRLQILECLKPKLFFGHGVWRFGQQRVVMEGTREENEPKEAQENGRIESSPVPSIEGLGAKSNR